MSAFVSKLQFTGNGRPRSEMKGHSCLIRRKGFTENTAAAYWRGYQESLNGPIQSLLIKASGLLADIGLCLKKSNA